MTTTAEPVAAAVLARVAAPRQLSVSPDALALLECQPYPGNVRELRNVADRWVLGLWRGFGDADVTANMGGDLKTRLAAHERALVEAELRRNNGRMKETYEALGLSRKGLYDKIRKLGIAVPEDG